MQALRDEKGKTSSMRVMSFIMLFASIGFLACIGYNVIIGHSIDTNAIFIFLICICGAFAPKTIQKFAEKELSR